MVSALAVSLAALLHVGSAAPFTWGYLPEPIVPADNPLTPAKVVLGKRLFHEARLSVTGTYTCASCHHPDRYFTDGLATAVGALGDHLPLNTPTLYFSAFNASLGWLESGPTTLEEQHRTPLLSRNPVEMGFQPNNLPLLRGDASYPALFAEAFGDSEISTETIIKALASYVRSLTPPVTAFDRYLFEDDAQGMSMDARAGMDLFFSERLGCGECHASLALSGPISHSVQQANPVFHVMGVSGNAAALRAPTLRYITHTAPYMHDGSIPSLHAVLEHYQTQPSPRVPAFRLTADETRQLLAFLHTL